jgi:hypothetical protein
MAAHRPSLVVTLYDENYFLVDNVLKRSSLSSQSAVKPTADGALEIYLPQSSAGRGERAIGCQPLWGSSFGAAFV